MHDWPQPSELQERIDREPEMVDLLIAQRRELVALTARHSQRYVMLALTIRKRLQAEEA